MGVGMGVWDGCFALSPGSEYSKKDDFFGKFDDLEFFSSICFMMLYDFVCIIQHLRNII